MPLYRSKGNVIFFIHIPKNGGSTIETALRQAGSAEAMRFGGKRDFSKATLQHIHAEVYSEAIGRHFYDWAFAVVRNPFTRLASEYKMKVIDKGDDEPIDTWAPMNFKRFESFPYTRDNHIRPQHEFLQKHVERFRFEDGLEAPILAACEQLQLRLIGEIPHRRKGSKQIIPIESATLEAIAEFYAVDFDTLGYGTDDYHEVFEVTE